MSLTKPSYEELEQRCLVAEATLAAIRSGETDSAMGEQGSLVLRLIEAEDALNSNRERLGLALEAAQAGIWEWDLRTNENYWSEELWRVYGLEPDSFQPSYEAWRQSIQPADRERVAHAVQEAALNGSELNAEWRVNVPDGKERWLMSRGKPQRDSLGNVVRYVGIVLDITERKYAEEEVRSAKGFLEMIIEMSPFAMWISDKDGMVIKVNQSLCEAIHLTPENIVGNYNPLMDKNLVKQGVMPAVRAVFERHIPARFSIPWNAVDSGSVGFEGARDMVIDVSMFPILDSLGHLINVVCQWVDITERLQAETRLSEKNATLAAIIESNNAPIFSLDRQYRYTGFNHAHARMMNLVYAADIQIGGKMDDYVGLNEDWQAQKKNIDRVFTGDTVTEVIYSNGWEKLHQQFEVTYHPVNTEGGEIIGAAVFFHDITERRITEAALKESEKRFSTIFRASPIGICLTGLADGQIEDVNDSFLEIMGYTQQEVAGKSTLALNLWADAGEHDRVVQLLRTQNRVHNLELRFRKKSGELGYSLTSAELIEIGSRLSMLSMINDITERKHAESEILESKAKLAAALSSMTDAIFISDVEGNFIDFNEAFATFHKFRSKEECSRTLHEYPEFLEVYQPNGDIAPLEQWAVPRALRGETVTNAEYSLRRKDTGETWVGSYSFAPIRNSEGVIVGSVVAGRDITEKKRAEEELQHLNTELERRVVERTAELDDLYNNAPCGYHSLDSEGTIFHINDTELRWLGYTREELIGKVKFQDLMTPASVQIFKANFPVFKRRGWVNDLEFDVLRKDGSILPILLSGTAINDKEGNYLMSRSTMVDYTDRKRNDAALRESRARLEVANKELEAFAYSVSHDLRSPLRAIDGWSMVLLEDYNRVLDAQGQRNLGRIRSEIRRMSQLIDDLLLLSRITRAEIQTRPVDFSEMAQAIIERLHAFEPGRQVEVIIHPGLKVNADPALLGIALTNLIENSWKFSGKQPFSHIEIGQAEIAGERVFFVRDNGVGFEMKYVDKLFGAFQRLHSVAEFPGTGIGLAIVQRIIQRHGGRVWVEAEVGHGATFYFTMGEG